MKGFWNRGREKFSALPGKIENWFKEKPYKEPKEIRKWGFRGFFLGLLVIFWFSLPGTLFHNPVSLVLEGSKGELLGASLAADHQWRFPPGSKVPDKFKQAIIQFEDKRFFHHPGVDPFSLYRALRQNLSAGKVRSGGSTLTMQVIRLYRQKPRTYLEKIWEMILALRLELSHSKEEILSLYAENAPFGSNIVGLEAASWRYFGRNPDNLSWAESCTLAVLPNNPNWVRPGKNKSQLEKKRDQLLLSLKKSHIISPETYQLSIEEPLPGKPKELPALAPHLLEFVKRQRNQGEKESEKAIDSRVQTPIQSHLQEQVNQILNQQIPVLQANYIHNAAVLVLDVETGGTLAYMGNINQAGKPEMESDVDVIQAPRSPGSTLKPLLYGSMLQDGNLLPHSLVADIPTNFAGYTPQNYDLTYDGAVPASRALSRSLNVPAVRMLYQYTYPRFYDQLKRYGIRTLHHPADFYGLSLILGGEEVTLWDLCGVYGSLARTLNHAHVHPGQYEKEDFHGPEYSLKSIERRKKKGKDLSRESPVGSTSIWYTFQAMEEVQRPGDESLWRDWSSSQRIAWKTGTSFGYRDAWAIGITPKYIVGVWVGNTTGEGRPGILGIRAAAPILFQVFHHLPSGPWFPFPEKESVMGKVCVKSGYRAGEYCDETKLMALPPSYSRSPICPFHQLAHVNPEKTYRINADCPGADKMMHTSWFVLPPTMEWFYRAKNPFYIPLPPLFPGCPNQADESSPLGMIYPDENAKIYVPIELNGTRGKVVFKAVQRGNQGTLFWHLDKIFLGKTNRFHELALDPGVGVHILTLEDSHGNTFERKFEILEPKNQSNRISD